LDLPYCIGYAISNISATRPSRCEVYTSTHVHPPSDGRNWVDNRQTYYTVDLASGDIGVTCFTIAAKLHSGLIFICCFAYALLATLILAACSAGDRGRGARQGDTARTAFIASGDAPATELVSNSTSSGSSGGSRGGSPKRQQPPAEAPEASGTPSEAVREVPELSH